MKKPLFVLRRGFFITDNNMRTLADEVRVFADRKNYPVVFHCVKGKDRTGILSYTLGALMGVSDEELMKDYELSFLQKSCMDNDSPFCMNGMREFRNYIKGYGNEDDSLKQKTEKMLVEHGLKESEIESIRDILAE